MQCLAPNISNANVSIIVADFNTTSSNATTILPSTPLNTTQNTTKTEASLNSSSPAMYVYGDMVEVTCWLGFVTGDGNVSSSIVCGPEGEWDSQYDCERKS